MSYKRGGNRFIQLSWAFPNEMVSVVVLPIGGLSVNTHTAKIKSPEDSKKETQKPHYTNNSVEKIWTVMTNLT